MNTQTESTLLEHGSSNERIGLSCRKDIKWTRTLERGETRFVASNPLKSDHFSCSEADHQILQWVAPDKTYQQVCEQFNQRFRPATLEPIELKRLLFHSLHSGVLQYERGSEPKTETSKNVPATPKNPILRMASAIISLAQYQISFGSPERVLDVIAKPLSILFTAPFVPFALLLFAFASLSVAYRWDEFWISLPTWQELRSPSAFIGYGLVFFATRALHELGHATACRRFGIACRDVGLLMSFGMICPYVDISEGWKSQNRFHRLTTAFGGIYFELLIASIAALVWCFTTSSFTNELCYQILLICSLTTILFNANPLMKYDGYYMLSDALGINNLREKSWQAFDRLVGGTFDASISKQLGLCIFFFGSLINRILLIGTLGWFIVRFAADWQMTGFAITGFFIYGLAALILGIASWIRRSHRMGNRIPIRAQIVGWVGTLCVLVWAMSLPLPKRTWGIGTFKPGDTISLYTTEAGLIDRRLPADGETITAGDCIVILKNLDLWKEKLKLQSALEQATVQWSSMDAAAFHDSQILDQKKVAESRLLALKIQLEEIDRRIASLNVIATHSGYFRSNPATLEKETGLLHQASYQKSYQQSRSGSLTLGMFLPQNFLIGGIITKNDPHIECEITKDQVNMLSIGTPVVMRLSAHPRLILNGVVSKVSSAIVVEGSTMSTSSVSQHAIGKTLVRIDCDELKNLEHCHGRAELMFHHFDQSMVDYIVDAILRNIRWR